MMADNGVISDKLYIPLFASIVCVLGHWQVLGSSRIECPAASLCALTMRDLHKRWASFVGYLVNASQVKVWGLEDDSYFVT